MKEQYAEHLDHWCQNLYFTIYHIIDIRLFSTVKDEFVLKINWCQSLVVDVMS